MSTASHRPASTHANSVGVGLPFCLPAERIYDYDKASVVFVQQHCELIARSAVLVSNGINNAAAQSWGSEHDDIVIYDAVSRVEFELRDHPERWVSMDGLPERLRYERGCGPVTLMLDNDQDSFMPVLSLMPDYLKRHGPYSLLSFPARNSAYNEHGTYTMRQHLFKQGKRVGKNA